VKGSFFNLRNPAHREKFKFELHWARPTSRRPGSLSHPTPGPACQPVTTPTCASPPHAPPVTSPAIHVVAMSPSPLSLSSHLPTTAVETEPHPYRSIHRVAPSLLRLRLSSSSHSCANPCPPLWLGIGARGRLPTTRVVFPSPPRPDAGESRARAHRVGRLMGPDRPSAPTRHFGLGLE
jgi:hypothetical protein